MIDTKKFHDELIDLWDNFYDTDGVYDIIFLTDDYIEVKCENKKVANQFADDIMAYYNAMICYDFRKGNGCYQFSISPSLMIRESKKSMKESIKVGDVVKNENRDDLFGLVYKVEGGRIAMYPIDKDTHTYDTRFPFTANAIDYEVVNFKVTPMKESKTSSRKSMKESRVDKGAVVYAFNCMLNELGYLSYDYSNESNNEKCDEIVYMIMDLLKTMPKV